MKLSEPMWPREKEPLVKQSFPEEARISSSTSKGTPEHLTFTNYMKNIVIVDVGMNC